MNAPAPPPHQPVASPLPGAAPEGGGAEVAGTGAVAAADQAADSGHAAAPALALGDDALVLSHRLAEWAGHAPVLEEEVALANIALDLLGQARHLLALAGDEDELAYLRDEHAFRNVQLAEQPHEDFAHAVVVLLFFSVSRELLLHAVLSSPHSPRALHGPARKAVTEIAYHRDHATEWTLRLGDGTAESHQRMRHAVDRLWRYTGELFAPVPGLLPDADWALLRDEWRARVTATLEAATLSAPGADQPDRDAWSAGAGRQGVHTEPFGRMLAEMQYLHRSHPGATW